MYGSVWFPAVAELALEIVGLYIANVALSAFQWQQEKCANETKQQICATRHSVIFRTTTAIIGEWTDEIGKRTETTLVVIRQKI
jgi:hypothetical protein